MPPTTSPDLRPPFVIGAYAAGELVEIPSECPWRDFAACDVVIHSLRPRKTGPPHALSVCCCRVHGVCFSVYPPGFVPYSRRSLIGEAPSGAEPSYGEVATEAGEGGAWARSAEGGTRWWWSTQWRLLRRLAHVLGGVPGARLHEVVAVALGLPLGLLTAVRDAVGYRARGRALTQVLAAVGVDLDGLLLAGALTGCWGAPWRWQRAPPRLVPLVPAHLDPAKASTTSERRVSPPFW